MRNKRIGKAQEAPRLYYKTKEEVAAYQKKSVKLKLQWLEAQMEFFHKAMSPEAKKVREKLRSGNL
jgi:hypothetical protein